MESIRQAVERAKAAHAENLSAQQAIDANQSREKTLAERGTAQPNFIKPQNFGDDIEEVNLKPAYLTSRRIIAHDNIDPRSRSFDILRTQVLRTMGLKAWQVVGITSPTAGCGKTLTAVNLALSIARLPEKSALLIDLDLRKPQVASSLGLSRELGIFDILEHRVEISQALVRTRIAQQELLVLPAERSALGTSELMASQAMTSLLQQIRKDYSSRTIIVDLPPMLAGDDVIGILPQLDCILLVAAVGQTTIGQIEECSKHLQSVGVVRVVLNKSAEATNLEYYY